MSGSRKRDFSLFGEGYDDEFEVEKTRFILDTCRFS